MPFSLQFLTTFFLISAPFSPFFSAYPRLFTNFFHAYSSSLSVLNTVLVLSGPFHWNLTLLSAVPNASVGCIRNSRGLRKQLIQTHAYSHLHTYTVSFSILLVCWNRETPASLQNYLPDHQLVQHAALFNMAKMQIHIQIIFPQNIFEMLYLHALFSSEINLN